MAKASALPALSKSSKALEALVNHPAIRPNLGGDGRLENAQTVLDLPGTVFMLGEQGGGLFIRNDGMIYEGHWLFLPGDTRATVKLARAMIFAMLHELEAELVWGQVPVQNRACRLFTRWVGLTSLGIRQRPDQQSFEIFAARRSGVIHSRFIHGWGQGSQDGDCGSHGRGQQE